MKSSLPYWKYHNMWQKITASFLKKLWQCASLEVRGLPLMVQQNNNIGLMLFVSTVLIVKHKNSANHMSQMENVWSSQHRIFVLNKNAFSVFLSSLDYCLLSTALCHDKELSRWHLKSHRFPRCTTTHLTTKLCNWSEYTDKDKGRNQSANPDTVRQLFERRIRSCTVSSSTRRCCCTSTLVLYYKSIRKLG